MSGVGEATVMITLSSSAEKVVEKDVETSNETVTESDSQGGSRTTKNGNRGETTIYNDKDSSGAPYISKELSPKVEGVIVIAEGGDDALVKQNITEAVQALFGIDTHKIRIMKKSSK
jgi:stage III sporulation protein AG